MLEQSTPLQLSFVIPVYRASETLGGLYERLSQAFAEEGDSVEFIFVEDAGGDGSWGIVQSLAKADRRVKGIRLSRNYGQHNALLCGIRAARGELIVTLDDDLQHPPEEIKKLLTEQRQGYDVVYGAPLREQHGLWRDLASQLTKFTLANAMGVENARYASALRVFNAHLRNAFSSYHSPTVNIDILLSWATNSFSHVKVRQDPRKFGETGYTPKKLIRHAVGMITGFSTLPLQFASIIGLLMAFFGFAVLSYIAFLWLFYGATVPGLFFLTSLISIFSGAQLISLGIFGAYLTKVIERMIETPQYTVREALNISARH